MRHEVVGGSGSLSMRTGMCSLVHAISLAEDSSDLGTLTLYTNLTTNRYKRNYLVGTGSNDLLCHLASNIRTRRQVRDVIPIGLGNPLDDTCVCRTLETSNSYYITFYDINSWTLGIISLAYRFLLGKTKSHYIAYLSE